MSHGLPGLQSKSKAWLSNVVRSCFRAGVGEGVRETVQRLRACVALAGDMRLSPSTNAGLLRTALLPQVQRDLMPWVPVHSCVYLHTDSYTSL